MYGINSTAKFDFLINKSLNQICIGLYQLMLNFDGPVTIATECTLHLSTADGATIEIRSDNHETARNLTCLLGSTVDTIDLKGREELTLYFSNDHALTIIDNSDGSESFSVTANDIEMII